MLAVGPLQLRTNLLLAPVAGYFDLANRLVTRAVPGVPCRPQHLGTDKDTGDGTYGALGLAFTELLCPHSLLKEADKAMWRAATSPEDRPVGMQLYGSDPHTLADAARWAQDHGATLIDINMGCPVDKVTKKHGGSKLLCDPGHAAALTRAVVNAVSVPVTTKIRLGWDDDQIIAHTLPPQLCDAGSQMVTVHGRTTAMKFKPSVRLEGIAAVVEAVKKHHPTVPVIGNGDITTPDDAAKMIDVTGCHGVMVARGAFGQPWLFRDIAHRLATGENPQPYPRADRARCVLQHFENLLRLRGEPNAVRTMKTRISKYSAHLQPWPGLRRAAQTLTCAASFRDFWNQGIAALERGEDPASPPVPSQPSPQQNTARQT